MTAGDVLVLGCLSRKLEGSCEARAPRTRAVVQGLQETECPLASVPSAGPLLFSPRPNMSLPPPSFFFFTHPFGKWSQFLEQVGDLIDLLG